MKEDDEQDSKDEEKANNELAVSLSKNGDLDIYISSQDSIEKSKKKAEDLIKKLKGKRKHKKPKYIS